MRRETQIIKAYANHTMLIPLQCVVHLEVFKISAGRDQNWSDLIRSEKLNHALQRSTSTLAFLKPSKFSGYVFQAWCHPRTQFISTAVQPHFLPGGLLWQMMIVISFPNYCITEINQNTEKSPGGLGRLAVTQTPVKDHQKNAQRITIIIILLLLLRLRNADKDWFICF